MSATASWRRKPTKPVTATTPTKLQKMLAPTDIFVNKVGDRLMATNRYWLVDGRGAGEQSTGAGGRVSRYYVTYTKTLSSGVEVEADTPSEAAEAADEAFTAPSLCAQCTGWGQAFSVDDSDWDIPDEPWAIQKVTE